MTCEHCTGTHYLLDQPDMGPCVCCTPEAMQRLEATLAKRDATVEALTKPKPLIELLDELEGIVSDVRDGYAEALTAMEASDGQLADTVAALSAYLVSIGLSANPVTMEVGPLRELCRAAGVTA